MVLPITWREVGVLFQRLFFFLTENLFLIGTCLCTHYHLFSSPSLIICISSKDEVNFKCMCLEGSAMHDRFCDLPTGGGLLPHDDYIMYKYSSYQNS